MENVKKDFRPDFTVETEDGCFLVELKLNNRIKDLRKREGLSQKKLANDIQIGESTLQNYECGKRDIPGEVVMKIAKRFGVSVDYVLGITEIPVTTATESRPVYGNISAGEPIEMLPVPGCEAYVIPSVLKDHPSGFFLKIHGESMNTIMPDGSLAYIDPHVEPKNGDVLAVNVNGDDATVKRVFFAGNTIVLHPESTYPEFSDRIISSNNPDAPKLRIIGKVVWHYLEHDDRL